MSGYKCLNCGFTASYSEFTCDHPACGFKVGRFEWVEDDDYHGYIPPHAPQPKKWDEVPFSEYAASTLGCAFMSGTWIVGYFLCLPILAFLSEGFRGSVLWKSYPSESMVWICGLVGFAHGFYLYIYKLLIRDEP